MSIDYDELEKALAKMKPRQRLYEIIKKEIKSRGHWKMAPRGKPTYANLKKTKK